MSRTYVLSLLLLGAAACGDSKSQAAPPAGARRGPMKFPVEVAPVEARRVEYQVTAIGTLGAFENVQVTARVPGAVERVLFAEGEVVKEGQPLVEIEPRRYQIAVATAKATLAKAVAAAEEAKSGSQRRETAVQQSPGLIPGEELETYRARQRSAEADVATARASLDLAQLNLRDAYVRAPVAGVIETRTVQTGQYLASGAVLATLMRRDPMLLRFQVAVTDSQKLAPGMTVKFRVRSEEQEYPATITHVGGEAAEASRMVLITAAVDQAAARQLRPGSFAEVTIAIGAPTDAPIVPQIAVRPSEKGFLAYVVEGEVAKERVLELGMRTADGRIEVRSGIKPGEKLVIRGAEALRDGAPVRILGKAEVAATRKDAAP